MGEQVSVMRFQDGAGRTLSFTLAEFRDLTSSHPEEERTHMIAELTLLIPKDERHRFMGLADFLGNDGVPGSPDQRRDYQFFALRLAAANHHTDLPGILGQIKIAKTGVGFVLNRLAST